MNIPVVDQPELRHGKPQSRSHRFWDDAWRQIETLPEGKAVRLSIPLLLDGAPNVLHNEGFSCGSWSEIKTQLDRRAKLAGKRNGGSPIRHAWSHDSVRDSEYVDVWLEGKDGTL